MRNAKKRGSRSAPAAAGKSKKAAPAKAKKPAKKPAITRKSAADLRIEVFVASWFANNFNGTRAALDAGFAPESARVTGSQLLAREDVQALIQKRQAAVIEKLELDHDWVLGRLRGIADADARELSELYIDSCRHCWGNGFGYQFTPREFREYKAQWEKDEAAKQLLNPPGNPAPLDLQGGVGFDPNKPPNPKCPECRGRGVRQAVFNDTRDLGPSARLLYAGVEETQHGFKLRTHSQTEALVNIGKHLGMFATRVKVGGDGDNPDEVKVGVVMIPEKAAGGADDE